MSSKKLTTEEYIKRARGIHGDEYDYSLVEFKNSSTKIKVICSVHNVFEVLPQSHANTNGKGAKCGKCRGFNKTTAEFVAQAKQIHGNKYNYSKVKYLGSHKKIEINCHKHGAFWQRASNHLLGRGCNDCGDEDRLKFKTKDLSDFIKQAKLVHKGLYKYEKVNYINSHTNVLITCKRHNDFTQLPTHHLKGSGCPKCGDEQVAIKSRITQEEFIKQSNIIHNNKYDYSKTKVQGSHKYLTVICPKHSEWTVLQTNHLSGYGCPVCGAETGADKLRFTQDEFLEKAREVHGGMYDYSKVVYIDSQTKVTVHCPEHGDFRVTGNNHLRGKCCPKCRNKSEGRIAEYLLKSNIIYREYSIENKRYDFFLPDHNLLIERDGEQHYRDVNLFSRGNKNYINEQQINDEYKTVLAKDAGFKIARIPYWLSKKEEEIEIENILAGKPTYPDVPDLKQEKTRPKPKRSN